MKMKVPQIVSARTKPMIRLLRSPMKSTSTPTTMATASTRLTRKALMAVVVAADWSEMMPASTPSGTWSSSSRARASTASPISTTLPPLVVEMPRPMARWPS